MNQVPPDEPRDITPEEVLEITNDVKETEKVEHTGGKEDETPWIEQFENVMQDFSADILYRTEIQAKSDEVISQSLILSRFSFIKSKRTRRYNSEAHILLMEWIKLKRIMLLISLFLIMTAKLSIVEEWHPKVFSYIMPQFQESIA